MSEISHLPAEIFHHIFGFCSLQDNYFRILQVCKQWQQVVSHPSLRVLPARKLLGVGRMTDSLAPLHPTAVVWKRAQTAAGKVLPECHLDGLKCPTLLDGRPIVAGRAPDAPYVALVDLETGEQSEAANLRDSYGEAFAPYGWYDTNGGEKRLLLREKWFHGLHSWNPSSGERKLVQDASVGTDFKAVVQWKGEPSLLSCGNTPWYQRFDVGPIESDDLQTSALSSIYGKPQVAIPSPQGDLVITWATTDREHKLRCWDTITGELQCKFRIRGEMTNIAVVGRGKQARLVTLGRRTDEEERGHPLLSLHLYSLQTGEFEQVLASNFAACARFAVSLSDKVCYLHALGATQATRMKEPGRRVDAIRTWLFVEGRKEPFQTGPVQTDCDRWLFDHDGFEVPFSLNRLMLPGRFVWHIFEPHLEAASHSVASDQKCPADASNI